MKMSFLLFPLSLLFLLSFCGWICSLCLSVPNVDERVQSFRSLRIEAESPSDVRTCNCFFGRRESRIRPTPPNIAGLFSMSGRATLCPGEN